MSERAKATVKTNESKTETSPSQTKKINFSPSINSPIDQILFLQRTAGNQAVEKLLKSGVIQAKLTIGQPGDVYEQEADRVAEQVIRMPDLSQAQRKGVSKDNKFPSIQRMCTKCDKELQGQTQNSELGRLELGYSSEEGLHRKIQGIQIQRICTECEEELHRQPMEEEEEVLQTKEVPGGNPEVTPGVEAQINSLRGSGQPLPESVRAFFEPRFGQDFSQVRIHTDSTAGESAKAVNALAYTVGQDMVFSEGQYSPGTQSGKKLIAHELTHVVHQGKKNTAARLQRQADISQVPPDLTCPAIPDVVPFPGTDILFAINSSVIGSVGRTRITNFVRNWHNAGSIDNIRIQGFASADGPQDVNWRLSCERAEAVRNELVRQGIATSKITVVTAHGASDKAPTADGNRRAVISTEPVPTARPTPTPVTPSPPGATTCPRSVSITVSRGNDDFGECQYETARIQATLTLDPCACGAGGPIPVTIGYIATLQGKSFRGPAGTIPEDQGSTIGRTFFLQEGGSSNNSSRLRHTSLGRPNDPDDTLDTQLRLLQTLNCGSQSTRGEVLVTNGGFVAQVITWSATASSSGVQQADINILPRPFRLSVALPLRPLSSPYPAFPGTPRDNRCTCHPVTGIHQGANCPPQFRGGAVIGP